MVPGLPHDTDQPDWAPPPVDTTRPSVARMYDCYQGGKDNFGIDREAAQGLRDVASDVPDWAVANRAFLADAVRRMATAGIHQFLDLGSGLPASPSVHEIARSIHPDAAVAYIDHDPTVQTHNQALLARGHGIVAAPLDLRQADAVLDSALVRKVIDLEQPVGLLMLAVLHFVEHETSLALIASYLDRLPAGSHLAISVASSDGATPDAVRRIEEVYRATASPAVFRDRTQVTELFGGLDLLDPGVVDALAWTLGVPSTSTTTRILVGLGQKR